MLIPKQGNKPFAYLFHNLASWCLPLKCIVANCGKNADNRKTVNKWSKGFNWGCFVFRIGEKVPNSFLSILLLSKSSLLLRYKEKNRNEHFFHHIWCLLNILSGWNVFHMMMKIFVAVALIFNSTVFECIFILCLYVLPP